MREPVVGPAGNDLLPDNGQFQTRRDFIAVERTVVQALHAVPELCTEIRHGVVRFQIDAEVCEPVRERDLPDHHPIGVCHGGERAGQRASSGPARGGSGDFANEYVDP